jgi:signal transduction histidine kinase
MAPIPPLQEQDAIVGAVVVEQTTNSILALQNKLIEESLTLTILVFSFGGIGLIFLASRLSSRIRRLGSQAASAISESGQIRSTIVPVSSRDEIGDISRTVRAMLNQLKIQTEYREKMADNLELEMRTPLAGISASLKNMAREMDNPPKHLTEYLNWALKTWTGWKPCLPRCAMPPIFRKHLAATSKRIFCSIPQSICGSPTAGVRLFRRQSSFFINLPTRLLSMAIRP